MFLNKKSIKPIGVGSFCVMPEEIRNKIRQGNYHKYTNFGNVEDIDIFYVIDDNVFDKKGLLRVISISYLNDGYWPERAMNCAFKKKSFIIQRNKLNLLLHDWKQYESVRRCSDHRMKHVINEYNKNFNLYNRNIEIQWEDK